MSFNPPEGILDIGNATLRVGKLEVAETTGLNQGLQNIVKNDLLVTEKNESSPYTTKQTWGLKLPTAWVGEFEVKGQTGKYIEFNFYNEGSTSNAQGYTLNFEDTSLTLKYDNEPEDGLATATIPTIVGTFRKVNIFFERGVIAVSIDGIRYLYYKESDTFNNGLGVASRVVSATGGAFVNLFFESDHGGNSQFKNLRIVNGRFISDKTSNVSFIGSLGVGVNNPKESLDIHGNMHLTRVSNVSQVSVDSNVVTEYTGPHDRPLRKYPEVVLTVASESASGENGYKVSSSSFNTGQEPYRAFNYSGAGGGVVTWTSVSLTNLYGGGDGLYGTVRTSNLGLDSGGASTPQGGTRQNGEWIKIQMPNKIIVSRISISRVNDDTTASPEDFQLYGSNDGTTWVQILSETGASPTATGTSYILTSTPVAYNYFGLVVTRTTGRTNYMTINDLIFYGREEGGGSLDTTLKTVYNAPATTGTQLEVYYDAKDLAEMPTNTVTDLAGGDQNGTVTGHSPTLDTTGGVNSFVFDGSSRYINGGTTPISGNQHHSFSCWLKPIAANSGNYRGIGYVVNYAVASASRTNTTTGLFLYNNQPVFLTWGNNLISNYTLPINEWVHVTAVYDGTGRKIYVNSKQVDSDTYSSYNINASGTLLIGASSTAADGGPGEVFSGSIANFRLFSKALSIDQVKELYDYQKDYFLGSKSQVTLYKGHLGVGVTEPSGQLELAGDEQIQEYPPRGMTVHDNNIEGHGVFKATSSEIYQGNTSNYQAWMAFNKINNYPWNGNTWNGGDDVYSDSTGLYTGNQQIAGIKGDWIKLELPYQIKLHNYAIGVRAAWYKHAPDNWVLLGSNDDNNWDELESMNSTASGTSLRTSRIPESSGDSVLYRRLTVNSTKYYRYFALVTTKLRLGPSSTNVDNVNISDLRYYGTPGPTTLDKGSLTLGRSLDVPRISRYDVDTETPRPEKLLFDYDTTVNSSVTDISGNGNHGTFFDDAHWSASDKAFEFDGTDDYTKTDITIDGGNMAWTQSMWFKINAFPASSSTYAVLSFFGDKSQTDGFIFSYKSDFMWQDWYGNGVYFPYTFEVGEWYHVVSVYHGNTSTDANVRSSMYVNGVKQPLTWYSSTSAQQNLPTSTSYELADYINASNVRHNGWISNPKFYTVALEPSEVKKLYNLGRTGRSMVISDTAVGIGKAPEAQLDVRGSLAVRGDVEAYGKNFNMSPAGNLSILGSIYGASVTAPYLRSHYDRYGFDATWRSLIATSAQDCGIGWLVNETGHQYALFWFVHAGNGTGYTGWIQNGSYTNIAYSGSTIKVQGPVGTITRAYILYLNNG